ncbi:MAG TPA: M20/M25/M40 family metallo-hydrolase [Candidatus Baltobacteraceae bacterium]|nr:M20/M25/M40 family metallo-hydrolase [Candidatus Baltobacteraceae bacterium]
MKLRFFSAFTLCAVALSAIGVSPAAGSASPSASNAQIRAVVAAVSAADLRAYDTKLVGFGTRNDFSETLNSPTRGIFAARDYIRAQFDADAARSNGHMTVALDTFVHPKTEQTPRDVTESSIIATLTGDRPGPTYVMSSHYDDCNGDCTDGKNDAPGADDNGSGSSAVLAAAKAMAGFTHFRGKIVFAVFDGEELGLWGAEHFSESLKTAGDDVVANLNNDIVGTPDTGGPDRFVVRVFSEALPPDVKVGAVNTYGTENSSPSRELARFIADVVPQYVTQFHVRSVWRADRFGRGGDQEEFQKRLFPAVRFVEAHENFYHQHKNVRVENGVQYGDLLKYIDFAYMQRVTQANVASLAALALGPGEPQSVAMPYHGLGYQQLGNDTTLTWTKAPGAASYEIVWRATDSPVWQHAKNVGDVTTATVPVSHDDYIIGVRSIGADGLRSVVVDPVPQRLRP